MIPRMPRSAAENDALMGDEALNRRPIPLAVSVATVGVLPVFLTGGLAVQVRSGMDFGPLVSGIIAPAALAAILSGVRTASRKLLFVGCRPRLFTNSC
jgi:hypothetical protein